MKEKKDQTPVWPEALAIPCPACKVPAPLSGMRPDGALAFYCWDHAYPRSWFTAESWTSPPLWPDIHAKFPWTADSDTRQRFEAAALATFLRTGVAGDYVIFQGAEPDEGVQFMLQPGGDGAVLAEVSSRQGCTVCPPRPLSRRREIVLAGLGFEASAPKANYASEGVPADPVRLAAVTETALRDAFEAPEDYGVLVRFSAPATAEAFYLGWSFASWR